MIPFVSGWRVTSGGTTAHYFVQSENSPRLAVSLCGASNATPESLASPSSQIRCGRCRRSRLLAAPLAIVKPET